MAELFFCDIETTGLRLDDEVWEVALVLHTPPDAEGKAPSDEEYLWQLPVDLDEADPTALRLNRFYERRWPALTSAADPDVVLASVLSGRVDSDGAAVGEHVPLRAMSLWAYRFAELTTGRIFAGMNPSFDAERLERLLRAFGVAPAWHYRTLCVETLAVGWVYGRPPLPGAQERLRTKLPWSSSDLAPALGLPLPGAAKHTALGDARSARDVWTAVTES